MFMLISAYRCLQTSQVILSIRQHQEHRRQASTQDSRNLRRILHNPQHPAILHNQLPDIRLNSQLPATRHNRLLDTHLRLVRDTRRKRQVIRHRLLRNRQPRIRLPVILPRSPDIPLLIRQPPLPPIRQLLLLIRRRVRHRPPIRSLARLIPRIRSLVRLIPRIRSKRIRRRVQLRRHNRDCIRVRVTVLRLKCRCLLNT